MEMMDHRNKRGRQRSYKGEQARKQSQGSSEVQLAFFERPANSQPQALLQVMRHLKCHTEYIPTTVHYG